MGHYDADAYLAALERPSVTINGHTYTGRILSIQQFLPFEARLQALSEGTEDYATFCNDYLYAIFPRPTLAMWKPDPVKQILEHPQLLDMMHYFLALQGKAITPMSQKMSGND